MAGGLLAACLYRPVSAAPTMTVAAVAGDLVAVPRPAPGAAELGLGCVLFLLGADGLTTRAAVRTEAWLPARLPLLSGALGVGLIWPVRGAGGGDRGSDRTG